MQYSWRRPSLRTACGIITLCAGASLGGCGAAVNNTSEVINGWDTYGYAAAVTCGARPVLLAGDSTDLTVGGPCRMVRVTGSHNDISILMAPGGTIEITGSHNDVTWHVPPGSSFRPILLDRGGSNEFHAPT